MRTLLMIISMVLCTISTAIAREKPKAPYSDTIGWKLCQDKEKFDCVIATEKTVEEQRGSRIVKKRLLDTWQSLFPDAALRELVMKLNRLNITLQKGMPLAVPKDKNKTLADFSPFPKWIKTPEEKLLIFDPALLAWAAYNENGRLVRWGPGLGGKDYCPDTKRACRTLVGNNFRVTVKGDKNSRSSGYPIDKSKPRARTPWIVYFYKHLYGIHGSDMMEGKHASHGCVRTFANDAEWINQKFTEIGTKVIVRPYPNKPKR